MSNLQRDALLQQAQSLLAKKDFSREDSSRVESLLGLADRCGPQAMQLRRAKMAVDDLSLGIRTADNAGDATIEAEFRQYLSHGQKALLSDTTLRQMAGTPETRMGQASGGIGAYLVPASFRQDLEVALKMYDGLFGLAGRWESATGSAVTVPILDDTSSIATVIAENDLSPQQDVTSVDGVAFGKTPTWRSGIVTVSRELISDSYFELSSLLAKAFAVRFGRGIGPALVAALIAGADVGTTTASSSDVASSELLDCMAALDPAYWGPATWVMNKATLISLMKLGMVTDPAGQAITMWTANPMVLFNKPVAICPSMDDIAPSSKPISFGDHSKVLRREVANSLTVRTLIEAYALNFQIGYSALWRVDCGFLKPSPAGSPATSQSPCQVIQCHS
ncbi:MAG: phage major capsid protein [Candidatus Korobacteraceae bacterium]